MDVGARAARDQIAQEQITRSVDTLAKHFKVKLDVAEPPRLTRDPAVNAMFSREYVAAMLDQIVKATVKATPPQEAQAEIETALAALPEPKANEIAAVIDPEPVKPESKQEADNGRQAKQIHPTRPATERKQAKERE